MRSSNVHLQMSLAAIALAAVTALAPAADVYVAGTIGEVYRGDSISGEFEQFGGLCLAPVLALAMDDAYVYAGDINGGVIRFDVDTGSFEGIYFVQNAINDLLIDDANDVLLAAHPNNTIQRIHPVTGASLGTLDTLMPAQSLYLSDGELYYAAIDGSIWVGDPVTGDFVYFGCGCAGTVEGLAGDDNYIYAADQFGQISLYQRATGFFEISYFLPMPITAMVFDGQHLLVSDGSSLHRVDPADGTILDTLSSPININDALLGPTLLAGDVNGDGIVGVQDMLQLLGAWGLCTTACPEDINMDGFINVLDLLIVLGNWGASV